MEKTKNKQKYNKIPLTLDEQVELLKERGLNIEDEQRLKYYLKNLSYYHLSIYFKHYQNNNIFYEGIGFEDVLRIYVFDNKLRFLLLDLLERIEKSFKCRVTYILSMEEKNCHWYLEEKYFDKQDEHQKILESITKDAEASRELSIQHYKDTYSDPILPPIWTILEIISFGQCVHIYKSLKKEYRNKIARSFGEDEQFITNWILCLSLLRNHCAHYSRLWNRNLTYIPKSNHNVYGRLFNKKSRRLYNYLVILQILLNEINPTSSWLEKLEEYIKEYKININHMGFPESWAKNLSEIITNTPTPKTPPTT